MLWMADGDVVVKILSNVTTGEHLAAQLQDTKAELKGSREEHRALQAELLTLARGDGKVKKCPLGTRTRVQSFRLP